MTAGVPGESERGSALLITMMVITVVGTIAFSVGASTISNLRRQVRLEDSLNAYAAASAGVEDGLLRWKFNRNTEAPRDRTADFPQAGESGDRQCPDAPRPTTGSRFVDRVNLSLGTTVFCLDPDTAPPPDPTQLVYDLKIHYKNDAGEPEVVEGHDTPAGHVPALKQDATVEYEVGNIAKPGGDVKLKLKVEQGAADPEDFLVIDGTRDRVFFPLDINRMISTETWIHVKQEADSIQLKYLGQDIEQYELHPPVPNSPTDPRSSIDGRITTIEATGYFGTAKRKLKLELDRQSGTILPLFDFALFSQQTGITSP